MNVSELIASESATIEEIGAYLDGVSHAERAEQVLKLGKKQQIALWDKAQDAPFIGPEYFVPADVPATTPVIHHGRNTLPAFKNFQKVMARSAGDNPYIFGYNEGSTRGLIGPGYFVVRATAGNADWEARGPQVVDYFSVPETECAIPEGWPKVKPNSSGLQVFVYNKTRDFMRRVSEHVSVGSAYKVEKKIGGAYFILCREPH